MRNREEKTYEENFAIRIDLKFLNVYIDINGVNLSISAIKTPISAINTVNSNARMGSP